MNDKVVHIDDMRKPLGDDKHTNSSKAVLHQVSDAETALFRVKPGGAVKAHSHTGVWDLFIGVSGSGDIHYVEDGEQKVASMREWSFCGMPPNVVHEVRNTSETDEFLFILIHAPWEGYDFVPASLPKPLGRS